MEGMPAADAADATPDIASAVPADDDGTAAAVDDAAVNASGRAEAAAVDAAGGRCKLRSTEAERPVPKAAEVLRPSDARGAPPPLRACGLIAAPRIIDILRPEENGCKRFLLFLPVKTGSLSALPVALAMKMPVSRPAPPQPRPLPLAVALRWQLA